MVGAGEPWLTAVDAAGAPRWAQRPPQADLREQARTLRISADGGVVDFSYAFGQMAPARFELARLALSTSTRPRTGRPGPRSRPPSRSKIGKTTSA
jgi:hypothetical protein